MMMMTMTMTMNDDDDDDDDSKWFEPRSISSLSSVIDRVSIVLKRTVGDSD